MYSTFAYGLIMVLFIYLRLIWCKPSDAMSCANKLPIYLSIYLRKAIAIIIKTKKKQCGFIEEAVLITGIAMLSKNFSVRTKSFLLFTRTNLPFQHSKPSCPLHSAVARQLVCVEVGWVPFK